jgi:D-3-phosphoglycerate dehydrogenase
MRLLIADAFSSEAQDALRAAGHDVHYTPALKGAELTTALAEVQPQALVVRSTKVTEADLDASPALELVVRAGAGVDTIDVAGASRRGIFVANCPGKNSAAVAELAMGLLLALDRRIPDNVADARAGKWNKAFYSEAAGLKGRTLGIVGFGSIGREVAKRAQAFGMRVVAWSRSLDDAAAAEAGVERMESPQALAAVSDAVSVHVASTPETRGLLDADFFAALKPGAMVINTARDVVIDDAAMRRAMSQKGIRVATDVPAGEPAVKEGAFDHDLAGDPGLYITHHIGASTEQASDEIGAEAVRIVLTYAETGEVANVVNLAEHSPATHVLTVRHLDRVGVLAAVLAVVREAGWNVQEMENLVFAGAEAACARIRFDGPSDAAALERIRAAEHVLAATVMEAVISDR